MVRIIKCKVCREEKPLRAKGMCNACYLKRGKPKITCKVCGERKRHVAKGMCESCYGKDGKPKIICKICGERKPQHAKGMCKSCYGKHGVPKIICKVCGEEKQHTGKGLCKSCYDKQSKPPIIVCKVCKEKKPQSAKGMCGSCYSKQYEAPKVACKECGKVKPQQGRGLCQSCYMKQLKRKIIKCKVCGEEKPHEALAMCKKCYVLYKRNENPQNFWTKRTLHSHKKRGYKIEIDPDILIELAKKTPNCEYCNRPLDWGYGKGFTLSSPTLDRQDNGEILTLESVSIVCWTCNSTKNARSIPEWIEYMREVLPILELKKKVSQSEVDKRFIERIRRKLSKSLALHIKRGYEIYTNKEEILQRALRTTNCEYCGSILEWGESSKNNPRLPTIDRRDNGEVLTLENISFVCYGCNRSKGARSILEWIDYMKRVLPILKEKFLDC